MGIESQKPSKLFESIGFLMIPQCELQLPGGVGSYPDCQILRICPHHDAKKRAACLAFLYALRWPAWNLRPFTSSNRFVSALPRSGRLRQPNQVNLIRDLIL